MSEGIVRHRFTVDAAHPSLPGHFPGDAVVPGVLLLDQLAELLEPMGTLARIDVVKFLAPLRPGEAADLQVQREGRQVRFRIDRDGIPIARGVAELASDAESSP